MCVIRQGKHNQIVNRNGRHRNSQKQSKRVIVIIIIHNSNTNMTIAIANAIAKTIAVYSIMLPSKWTSRPSMVQPTCTKQPPGYGNFTRAKKNFNEQIL
jgi:hypothetical protein